MKLANDDIDAPVREVVHATRSRQREMAGIAQAGIGVVNQGGDARELLNPEFGGPNDGRIGVGRSERKPEFHHGVRQAGDILKGPRNKEGVNHASDKPRRAARRGGESQRRGGGNHSPGTI